MKHIFSLLSNILSLYILSMYLGYSKVNQNFVDFFGYFNLAISILMIIALLGVMAEKDKEKLKEHQNSLNGNILLRVKGWAFSVLNVFLLIEINFIATAIVYGFCLMIIQWAKDDLIKKLS